jgi:hypothetical protein
MMKYSLIHMWNEGLNLHGCEMQGTESYLRIGKIWPRLSFTIKIADLILSFSICIRKLSEEDLLISNLKDYVMNMNICKTIYS